MASGPMKILVPGPTTGQAGGGACLDTLVPVRSNNQDKYKRFLIPIGGSYQNKTSIAPYPFLPPLLESFSLYILVILGSGGGVHAHFLHVL